MSSSIRKANEIGSVVLCFLFLASVCRGQARQPEIAAAAGKATLHEVLSWLPEDTETVIGTGGTFAFPDLHALPHSAESPELTDAELAVSGRVLPLGLFFFKNGGLQEILNGRAVSLALEGSRNYKSPMGLGETKYEGCAVLVLDSPLTVEGDNYLTSAAASAVRTEEVAGVRVVGFEERQEEDVWQTFAGFPRKDVVVVATSASYLKEVLTRMSHSAIRSALPDSLPEWKYVDTRAVVWGLRHYTNGHSHTDPTSPFSGTAPANVPDALAQGFAFHFDVDNPRQATVTYLSRNPKARILLSRLLSAADEENASPREFQVRVRRVAPGATEGKVALVVPEFADRFLLCVGAMLGHAVYL